MKYRIDIYESDASQFGDWNKVSRVGVIEGSKDEVVNQLFKVLSTREKNLVKERKHE